MGRTKLCNKITKFQFESHLEAYLTHAFVQCEQFENEKKAKENNEQNCP